MIIGKNKKIVIDNIKEAIKSGDYNRKVEVDDPNLSLEQKSQIIDNFLNNRNKFSYKFKNRIANFIHSFVTYTQNKNTKIVGIENIIGIDTGAIITSNHFNPLDNTAILKFVKQAGKKKLNIVVQETNLAMTGLVGFMMNYSNIIPISDKISYMKNDFPILIKEKLDNNEFILIYPEQEMWFNYKKPRTLKPGAYFYAAKNEVPIIPCFVEMRETNEKDNDEFYKINYTVHVLNPIFPDSNKSVKENANYMMENDYKQKQKAYEDSYNKKLDYTFDYGDIAGLI